MRSSEMPTTERLLLMMLAIAGAIAFAIITPVGEAPDEPAHIGYVQYLAREWRLPSAPESYDRVNYEAHQPPLGYFAQAAVLRVMAQDGIHLDFRPNPSFDFNRSGSRAFIHPAGGREARRAVIAMRIVQIGWLLLAMWASMEVACAIAPASQRFAAAYLLAPQLLFVTGAVSNDIALIACASLTLLLLIRFVNDPSNTRGAAAGLALTAALFAKGAALFLGLPIAVAAIMVARRKSWAPALALIATSCAALGVWIGVNVIRFGTIMPPVPTAGSTGTFADLALRPRWIGSLFVSFWGKFGWFNTPMPAVTYIWFALLTVVALLGLRRMRTPAGAVIVSAIAGNLIFIALFLVMVDWQPQGRYLLPSISAIAALGASGLPRR
ncbi:MAG: DUF2142 domain-containing protein [Thermoanaerobaculia bacterium]|nr:DUF2142 domain-containing protein [Thermoanaerobaculia bacterium]